MAIELDVRRPSPCVVLHAAHMNVTAVTLLGAGMQDGVPGTPGSWFTYHVTDGSSALAPTCMALPIFRHAAWA